MILRFCFYILLALQLYSYQTLKANSAVLTLNTSVQNTPTAVVDQEEAIYYEDDFNPFLLFLLVFALIGIAIGVTLTIVVLLIIFGGIGAGILSASILVGLHKKSFSKGFKTFLVSVTTIGGLIVGLVVFWAIHEFMAWWSLSTALISGGITGTIAGFLLGYFVFYVIQKLTTFLKSKLKK